MTPVANADSGRISARSAGLQPARSPGTPRRPLHADLGRTAYFVSTRVQKHEHVFVGPVATAAIDNLLAMREEHGFRSLAYVFMPDHAHFVVVPSDGDTISSTVRAIKGRIARNLNKLLGREGALWQGGFWDEAPRSVQQLNAYIDYVHANPVKAGLCRLPDEYPFSSVTDSRCVADYRAFFETEREQPSTLTTAPPIDERAG